MSLTACAHGSTEPTGVALQAFRELASPPTDLRLAEAELIRRCLVQAGFPDAPTPPMLGSGETLLGLPGSLSAEVAATQGYGSDVARTPNVSEASGFEAYLDALDPQTRAKIDLVMSGRANVAVTLPTGINVGAPRSGCYAQMRTQLYGSVRNWLTVFYLPQAANKDLGDIGKEKPVRAADRRYIACMRGQGQSVTDWREPLRKVRRSYELRPEPSGQARPSEIETAVADANCRETTHLPEVYVSAAAERASDFVIKYEKDLLAASEIEHRAADRAVAALAK